MRRVGRNAHVAQVVIIPICHSASTAVRPAGSPRPRVCVSADSPSFQPRSQSSAPPREKCEKKVSLSASLRTVQAFAFVHPTSPPPSLRGRAAPPCPVSPVEERNTTSERTPTRTRERAPPPLGVSYVGTAQKTTAAALFIACTTPLGLTFFHPRLCSRSVYKSRRDDGPIDMSGEGGATAARFA